MVEGKAIRILGVGNVLCSDDGLGPYVIKVLESEYEFADDVEVIDVGTPGLDFTPYLADAKLVVVVDTVRGSEPPGSLRVLRDGEIVSAPPPPRMSPHEPGLREALMATEFSDSSPEEIVLVGVIPQTTDGGTHLSDPVRSSVRGVVDLIVAELARLERPVVRREPPAVPDIWWE
jgi:hydrogenase maturation protease